MKAFNQQRKNQILFGLLVLTLAMSKSWFATADSGRHEFASTAVTGTGTVKQKDKEITYRFSRSTIKKSTPAKPKKTIIRNGQEVPVEPEDMSTPAESFETVAQITIDCEDCPGGQFTETHVLPDGDPESSIANFAATMVKNLEKQKRDEERFQRRVKSCEAYEVDGEKKDVSRVNFKDVDEVRDMIIALEENKCLKYNKFPRALLATIRELYASDDESDHFLADELLDELKISNIRDADLLANIKEIENLDRGLRGMRRALERNQPLEALDIAQCMDPNFESRPAANQFGGNGVRLATQTAGAMPIGTPFTPQLGGANMTMRNSRNVPARVGGYSCHQLGYINPINQGHYDGMQDNYVIAQKRACDIASQALRSYIGGVCSTFNTVPNIDGVNYPVDVHGNGVDANGGRFNRVNGNGSPATAPAYNGANGVGGVGSNLPGYVPQNGASGVSPGVNGPGVGGPGVGGPGVGGYPQGPVPYGQNAPTLNSRYSPRR